MGNFDSAPVDGSCKGKPVDWWFPVFSGLGKAELIKLRASVKVAIDICNSCPVSEECLEYSLRHEPWGIWGGLKEEERANIRWERNILLSRDGRINFSGIGLRSANGEALSRGSE